MSALLLILLISFGGLVFLAASPFIVYKMGKNFFYRLAHPYEKAIQTIQTVSHEKKYFLTEISNQPFFLSWIRDNKLSVETTMICLALMDESTRNILIRQLPKKLSTPVDDILRRTKKVKGDLFNTATEEINQLLLKEIKNKNPRREIYVFYYFDNLYNDLNDISKNKYTVNLAIQQQIEDIINRSLQLLPYFDELNLFEYSHKFKTLIQKDLKESLRLFSTIDDSQQTNKETELYSVLKTILKEIDEIEQKISSSNEDELKKRMLLMKQKFKVYLDEE